MEVILYLGQSQPLVAAAALQNMAMLIRQQATAVPVAAVQDAVIPMLVLEQQDKALTAAAEEDAGSRVAAVAPEALVPEEITHEGMEAPEFSTLFWEPPTIGAVAVVVQVIV
jgi:hypothetical protein